MGKKCVSMWVALQQSLRAIEAVGRFWATQLGLEPTDVLLILLVGRAARTPTVLGNMTGRTRQQVHRSLLRLEALGLVEADGFSRRGRVAAWRLSPPGLLRLDCLERRMAIWEQHLSPRVEIDALIEDLRVTLRALVNRSMEGYFEGLYVPDELRRDPNLEFMHEAMKLRESDAHADANPSPTTQRKEAARRHAEAAEMEDEEAARAAWQNLWA